MARTNVARRSTSLSLLWSPGFSQPPGSYDICSICFWEDDLSQLRSPRTTGANHVSLTDGQKNYRELGACEGRLKPHVRKPKDNEAVEPGWRPINLETDEVEDPIPGTDYFALQPGRRPCLGRSASWPEYPLRVLCPHSPNTQPWKTADRVVRRQREKHHPASFQIP